MKARILPQSEWGRLAATNLCELLEKVGPDEVDVVVVEDGDTVIACIGVLRATHFEGAWIEPEHRNAGVTRALLRLASEVASTRWVFAGAAEDHMRSILDRLGGVRLPMDTYIVDLGGEAVCRLQS